MMSASRKLARPGVYALPAGRCRAAQRGCALELMVRFITARARPWAAIREIDMKSLTSTLAAVALLGGLAACGSHNGAGPVAVADDGQLDVPAFWLPFSRYASHEAAAAYVDKLRHPDQVNPADIPAARAFYDEYNKRYLAKARAAYPVRISHATLGGVPVDVVVPEGGVRTANAQRVLINLHGGAFLWGAGAGGQLEAVPIAALMGITVVTVDYRLGPENRFPAASEDVAAVYRELLKTHAASAIGIYGCSAGGVLTAQSLAWLQKAGLPPPGAAGIFCAGDGLAGDSSYVAGPLTGQAPVTRGGADLNLAQVPYFAGASMTDPLVAPTGSATVLRAFPPVLVISGTRDFAMSAAIDFHRQLVKAGVPAELHLWDGMWHAFFMDVGLPESREVYAVIGAFFDAHLARPAESR
jgi:acetyl esterase/lipase